MILSHCIMAAWAVLLGVAPEPDTDRTITEQAQHLLDIAQKLYDNGDLTESREVLQAFLVRCGAREDELAGELGAAHKLVCEILKEQKRPYLAIPHAQEAVRLFQQTQQLYELGQARKDLGLAYSLMGDVRRARQHFEQLLPFCSGFTGADTLRAQCLHNIGITLSKKQRHSDAMAYLDQALSIYRNETYAEAILGVASCQVARGISLGRLGRVEEAGAALLEAVGIYDDHAASLAGARAKAGRTLMYLGWVWYGAGSHQQAVLYFQASIERLEEAGDADSDLVAAWRGYARCARIMGDLAAARFAYQRATDLERSQPRETEPSPSLDDIRRLTGKAPR